MEHRNIIYVYCNFQITSSYGGLNYLQKFEVNSEIINTPTRHIVHATNCWSPDEECTPAI